MPARITFDRPQARHLLARAGFGGRHPEIDTAVDAGLDATVDQLLAQPSRQLPVPSWFTDFQPISREEFAQLDRDDRQRRRRQDRQQVQELLEGWLDYMIDAPTLADMLESRMAFIWHGLFVSTSQKVQSPIAVYRQIRLFYQQALGNYGDLLHGIIRDPAMLQYLDNIRNRRGNINENLAREIMELFSLGIGHYTETDIKEGARALTGYTIDRLKAEPVFRPFMHDRGQKTILNRTGAFDGDDFVRILLQQPACPRHIAARLWTEFAGTPCPDDLLPQLADTLSSANYAIRPFLRALFTHPRFYGPDVIGQQIRSPIQLVVGTARTLRVQAADATFYGAALHGMGQVPYRAPNVKGWPGGRSWITTSRLLTRYSFGQILADGELPDRNMMNAPGMRMNARTFTIAPDPAALLPASTGLPAGASAADQRAAYFQAMVQLLMAVPPTPEEAAMLLQAYQAAPGPPDDPLAARQTLGRLMVLPQYQLT